MKQTTLFLRLTLSLLAIASFSQVYAQTDVRLRLEAEKSALLAGESGTFDLIVENTSSVTVQDVTVSFTLSVDFEIELGSTQPTNGTFGSDWTIASLEAGGIDTLSFSASSSGYAIFIAEVTSNSNLLINRCISSDCYPSDNFRCFYTNCTPEMDEALYPSERFDVTFQSVECALGGPVGCASEYNITFENSSDVASAPMNLFLRANIQDGAPVHRQSGETLQVPSIPANSTLEYVADFGECIELSQFERLLGLSLSLTQTEVIGLFVNGRVPAPLSMLDATTNTEYCFNGVDLELRMESQQVPLPIFQPTTIFVYLRNVGTLPATGIEIDLDLSDRTQAVLVGNFEAIASDGIFRPVPSTWSLEELGLGEEARLEVQYFPLVEDYTPYAQVVKADQEDIDSTPNNGVCCNPNEDDEASISLGAFVASGYSSTTVKTSLRVFPNPTQNILQVKGKYEAETPYVIFDLLGKVVKEGQLENGELNVQQLPNGAYFLKVEAQEIAPIRFVKL